ncbi:BLUF domain-containing protein [Mucilaginibacter phyllosphaerae]|uniref:BLUF domain-containing protein n=1 Tax=Mucilaginibacter phyllosphaerae TaxID=1812349 RepID=A0A4Y8AD05_9SPHI|nr:BLUF domain-containing protein [Mucilaginibacter phyllosphaerae]MBB3970130.1 hypothetical protein [Mucilaginibacter phyllosphaerae]TEW66517.1 BLUF domain-containing protein [Mucilaginibacter phyllosphaerae]GGH09953.1 hypothetical protein GCM10007352_15590 [Mucilaginibacter phyllosphaerae]
MLYYLIYFSTATKLMQKSDLEQLLTESRTWNESHGLTGMLAYIEGSVNGRVEARFMQVLEGKQEEVQWIFNKIKKDARHTQVTLLKEADLKERRFNNWSMKFENVDLDAHPDLISFFHMEKEVLESDEFKNSDIALDFLKAF